MRQLTSILTKRPEFRQLVAAMDTGSCPAAVTGLSAVHRAHLAASLRRETGRCMMVVCADEGEAARMAEDLAALSGETVHTLPTREFTFHNAAAASRQWEHRRLSVLRALAAGEAGLVVTTVEALLQRTIPASLFAKTVQRLRMGARYVLEDLAQTLITAGYTRCDQVEGVGQFALRGGILDFFSPAQAKPVRMEFFGDEVDSMGLFDPGTQRRLQAVEEAELLPVAEVLPQLAPGGYPGLLEALDKLIARSNRRKNRI